MSAKAWIEAVVFTIVLLLAALLIATALPDVEYEQLPEVQPIEMRD